MTLCWKAMVCLCFLVPRAWADEVSLVPINTEWRYFKGFAAPSMPPSAWQQPGFDDSTWLTGWASFAYGGSWAVDATQLDFPSGYTSVAFRKTFVIAAPERIKWLTLRIDYSSGFVAYLNGQEVARRGLPGNAGAQVPYDTTASYHARGVPELIDLTTFTNLLVVGSNLLAIQAHNYSSYGVFALAPELLANFVRGPFIQNTSSNRTDVLWRTQLPAHGWVEFGLDPTNLNQVAFAANASTNHVLCLKGLTEDTRYYYRVVASNENATATSPLASFRTLKSQGSLSFTVFGDDGSGNVHNYEVDSVIGRTQPDLVLHTGDIIYMAFSEGLTDYRGLSVHRTNMTHLPFFYTFGNHDLYDVRGDQNFLDAFSLPTNSVTGTQHFYSFDHGDAHFVSLFIPLLNQYDQYPELALSPGSAQYQWLTNDLAQSGKPWKFLFFHCPPRTSGPHRADEYNNNGIPDHQDIETLVMPLAAQYGVQMIFNGHDHDYERFAPINGVHCVVTGGGGFSLYSLTERDEASAQFYSIYHCVRVAITNDTLTMQAIDSTGRVFDCMSIQRSAPTNLPLAAEYHTLTIVTSKLPSDGDGNYASQYFDFRGTPIPAVAGGTANLGRAWVQYDDQYLYVGLDNVMIRDNQVVALFLASPRKTGVSSLAGLGNGVADPQGQGADGLDFLAHLSFTNFQPCLAFLLGDERADGTFRSFTRQGTLACGQGGFFLDPGFSTIPGTILQQFNRSPQITDSLLQSSSYENNADFIQVAIPISALGGLLPGEVLQIGAIAATMSGDDSLAALAIDSGYLGSHMSGSGLMPCVLEGLPVKLSLPPPKLSLGLHASGQALMRWTARAGDKYDLETSTDLPNFAPAGLPGWPRAYSVDTNETFLLALPKDSRGFFRLKLVP